jgi:hypothetical protein
VLPAFGAIVLGQIAFVFAYGLAPLRPLGADLAAPWESAPGEGEPATQTSSVPDIQSVPVACPKCHADLRGDVIAPASRAVFGGATHFSRVIGIYSHEADATVAWQCPDCDHEWMRTEPFSFGLRTYQLISRFRTEPNQTGPG